MRWLSNTEEEILGVGTGQGRKKVLADAITIDGRKEWICKFCSKTKASTQRRCRRCGNNIPTGLEGKHKQAAYTKNKEWYSGSSSSSGREEWKSQEQEEIKRLRAQVELLSKQQGTEKSPEEPGEPARSGRDCEKKSEEQKKSLQRQLRDIEKFASMDPVFRERQKEMWIEELEDVEEKNRASAGASEDAEEVTKAVKLAG